MLGRRKKSWLVVITPRQKKIQKQVGARLRELREKQGLSQAELAALCYLDRSHVGAVERGRMNITIETLVVLCVNLGTTVAKIYKGIA